MMVYFWYVFCNILLFLFLKPLLALVHTLVAMVQTSKSACNAALRTAAWSWACSGAAHGPDRDRAAPGLGRAWAGPGRPWYFVFILDVTWYIFGYVMLYFWIYDGIFLVCVLQYFAIFVFEASLGLGAYFGCHGANFEECLQCCFAHSSLVVGV